MISSCLKLPLARDYNWISVIKVSLDDRMCGFFFKSRKHGNFEEASGDKFIVCMHSLLINLILDIS